MKQVASRHPVQRLGPEIPEKRSNQWAFWLMAATLPLALLLIAADSIVRLETVAKVSAVSLNEVPPGTLRVAPGAREEVLVPPDGSMDARWWVIHTEQMLTRGGLRVRETMVDNAPNGRAVHWSSLLMWILAALAQIGSIFAGVPAVAFVAESAMIVGPLMFAVSLCGLGLMAWRGMDWKSAVFLAVAVLTNPAIYRTFQAGEADHHGIVLMFAAGSLLSLVCGGAGFVVGAKHRPSPGSPVTALKRRWFRLAGVLGAAALWVSAATALPVIAATGVGACLGAWRSRKMIATEAYLPDLWETWGRWGCSASLFFYLLEYFPGVGELRLEVNHPLYAFAWLAGGFLVCRVTQFLSGGKLFDKGGIWKIPIAMSVALTPALLILTNSQTMFWVRDPFLLALHKEYILEFQSMLAFIRSSPTPYAWMVHYAWPAFAIGGTLILWVRGSLTEWGKRMVLLVAPATLVMQVLTLSQIRWVYAAMALWTIWALVVFASPRGESPKPLFATWGAAAAAWFALVVSLAPQLAVSIQKHETCLQEPIAEEFGNGLLLRDVAHRLIQSSPNTIPIVLAGPNSSTHLSYHGGIHTLGTLYWENMPGLKRAAEIFAASDEAEAFRLLSAARVSHIVIPSWENFGAAYARLYSLVSGKPPAGEEAPFFRALVEDSSCPQWIRPYCYPITSGSGTDSGSVRIFAFVPNQSRFEWLYFRGLYQLEAGHPAEAKFLADEALLIKPGDGRVMALLEAIAEATKQ